MKTDIITVVVLVFCLGVFASAIASSDLFSGQSDDTAVLVQTQD